MKFASMKKLFGIMCVALVAVSSAQAATVSVPISDLYNTGMSSPWNAGVQTPLAGSDPGVAVDPHWDVYHDPAGALPYGAYPTQTIDDASPAFASNQFNRLQRDLGTDPNKANSDLDNSQWITSTQSAANGNQVYVFETTFTTSQALTTVSISGFFKATDLIGVQLNEGAIVDQGTPHGFTQEQTPVKPALAFSVTGTAGLTNTLRFYVNRPGGGVSNFRAQFTNATFTVPEPSTIVLGALGLVGFGASRLRRRFFGAAETK